MTWHYDDSSNMSTAFLISNGMTIQTTRYKASSINTRSPIKLQDSFLTFRSVRMSQWDCSHRYVWPPQSNSKCPYLINHRIPNYVTQETDLFWHSPVAVPGLHNYMVFAIACLLAEDKCVRCTYNYADWRARNLSHRINLLKHLPCAKSVGMELGQGAKDDIYYKLTDLYKILMCHIEHVCSCWSWINGVKNLHSKDENKPNEDIL